MTTSPASPAPASPPTGAWAAGLATTTADGTVLDAWFPTPALGLDGCPAPVSGPVDAATLAGLIGVEAIGAVGQDAVRGVEVTAVVTRIDDLADPPRDAADVYLRLHLLSHRLVEPHGQSMDGVFGLLANVVWTTAGPCAVADFEATRLRLRAAGRSAHVLGIDKFPRMVDYVVPSGVRIADADRVRLGAHLAEGTTVMHEGFVNFNAGTLGTSMVEGRISAGVVIGDGSDLGGSASVAGTLSGGGKEVISVGRRCLVGANAGIGISLGDDCVVEAGCYITPGSKVRTPDGQVVKARELSGRSGLQYWRNSQSGALEVTARQGDWGGLNAALHAN